MKKTKTPKHWTAKAWAEHMLWISGFTNNKEVNYVQSNTRGKVPRKSNKSKQSSKATV
ncbi:hypothetical protein OAN02_00185 [bacterium]|jgi:hypothetical protein|nr:hypothetical protein [bacterium]|tara:strand:+ start:336 stop:509 length:174 start_codon:yes stop_codon:yes gene_type:complete